MSESGVIDADRFLRQIILPEVGEGGQRALGVATAHVGGETLAHEVAALYAHAAGFDGVRAGAIDLELLAPESLVREETARLVLAGARATLGEIRRALSMSTGGIE